MFLSLKTSRPRSPVALVPELHYHPEAAILQPLNHVTAIRLQDSALLLKCSTAWLYWCKANKEKWHGSRKRTTILFQATCLQQSPFKELHTETAPFFYITEGCCLCHARRCRAPWGSKVLTQSNVVFYPRPRDFILS